jgi:hypothetical protein
LSSLNAAPVNECDGREPRVRSPAHARQQEVDNGLVHFLIDDEGIDLHWVYAATYQLYSVAARLKTTAGQRRLLYARLPCGVRRRCSPRKLKQDKQNGICYI